MIGLSPADGFDMLTKENKDIHGVVVDHELITPSEVIVIKEKMDDQMFPVILLSGELSDEEAGKWIACGVSDIFQLPMPCPLMARRLGSVIQLYCVTQSLHG